MANRYAQRQMQKIHGSQFINTYDIDLVNEYNCCCLVYTERQLRKTSGYLSRFQPIPEISVTESFRKCSVSEQEFIDEAYKKGYCRLGDHFAKSAFRLFDTQRTGYLSYGGSIMAFERLERLFF